MIETLWLACSHPTPLLEFLGSEDTASDRKLRLVACACCRRLWHLLTDERSRAAVEAGERFADDPTSRRELRAARRQARAASRNAAEAFWPSSYGRRTAQQAALAAAGTTAKNVVRTIINTVNAAAVAVAETAGLAGARRGAYAATRQAALAAEQHAQAALVREIVGNPFRPLPRRSFPAHVVGLARSCYDAFPATGPEYAILADGLEELGEVEAAAHCRQEGHARGCHVVDWITAGE
jgi:hypothetical protein